MYLAVLESTVGRARVSKMMTQPQTGFPDVVFPSGNNVTFRCHFQPAVCQGECLFSSTSHCAQIRARIHIVFQSTSADLGSGPGLLFIRIKKAK
jgi:hypothetical protein